MPYADLYDDNGNLTVRVSTKWNEKELISSIPGARYGPPSSISGWTVPLTWPTMVMLRGVFGSNLLLSDSLVKAIWDIRYKFVDPAMKLRDQLDHPLTADLDERLFPYQRAAVAFMHVAGSGLLCDEMGTGKSVEVMGYLKSLHLRHESAFPVLIVCPNSVKYHWARHVERWLPFAKPFLLDGSMPTRRKLIESARAHQFPVVIVNIEAVRSLSRLSAFGDIALKRCTACDKYADPTTTPAQCETHWKELNNFDFVTVVVDEAHRIKEPRSKQTRAVWSVAHDPSVKHIWALTGTPIANNIRDLWAVMHTVNPIEYPTLTKFVDRYALQSWNAYGGLEISGIRPDTFKEFHLAFMPRFRRVQKEVVLPQLPPKLFSDRSVEMSPRMRKMYNELSASLTAQLPDSDDTLITKTQLAAFTRLSQLAVASVRIESKPNPDDPSTWVIKLCEPSPKIDELVAIVDELGNRQAVVAADHRQLIELASVRLKKLNISHALITGDVALVDRQRALDALAAKKIQLLLFTSRAGGVGIDMSMVDTLIFLQHPWSLVEYLQTIDRVHRIGSAQHEAINIINVITRGTVEERKLLVLMEKYYKLDEVTRDSIVRAARLNQTQLQPNTGV